MGGVLPQHLTARSLWSSLPTILARLGAGRLRGLDAQRPAQGCTPRSRWLKAGAAASGVAAVCGLVRRGLVSRLARSCAFKRRRKWWRKRPRGGPPRGRGVRVSSVTSSVRVPSASWVPAGRYTNGLPGLRVARPVDKLRDPHQTHPINRSDRFSLAKHSTGSKTGTLLVVAIHNRVCWQNRRQTRGEADERTS